MAYDEIKTQDQALEIMKAMDDLDTLLVCLPTIEANVRKRPIIEVRRGATDSLKTIGIRSKTNWRKPSGDVPHSLWPDYVAQITWYHPIAGNCHVVINVSREWLCVTASKGHARQVLGDGSVLIHLRSRLRGDVAKEWYTNFNDLLVAAVAINPPRELTYMDVRSNPRSKKPGNRSKMSAGRKGDMQTLRKLLVNGRPGEEIQNPDTAITVRGDKVDLAMLPSDPVCVPAPPVAAVILVGPVSPVGAMFPVMGQGCDEEAKSQVQATDDDTVIIHVPTIDAKTKQRLVKICRGADDSLTIVGNNAIFEWSNATSMEQGCGNVDLSLDMDLGQFMEECNDTTAHVAWDHPIAGNCEIRINLTKEKLSFTASQGFTRQVRGDGAYLLHLGLALPGVPKIAKFQTSLSTLGAEAENTPLPADIAIAACSMQ